MSNKILLYYNYERALQIYKERILHMRQARGKSNKNKIIAKPILLLTVLTAVDHGYLSHNRFDYQELKERYAQLFGKYFVQAGQEGLTPMYHPFYHLCNDGFWHFSMKNAESSTECSSERWLVEHVNYAFFDEDLWVLISHPEYRKQLINFIIEHKLQHPESLQQGESKGLRHTLSSFLGFILAI